MKRFLRFVVECTLAGEQETIKEYSIAVAVFDKPDSFDPRLDPIVRVEAGRLRSKLRDYYEGEGQNDPVRIGFPKRSYVPDFEAHQSAPAEPLKGQGPAAFAVEAPGSPTFGDLTSLAVLPFADLSPEGDHEYFCDGITEEIIHALSGVEGLQVVSRTSVMQFKGQARDIRQIGMDLNAGAVLEGSVRRVGRRVRITAQLINVVDGYNLWSDIYDREVDDIFDVQEQIAQSIVKALRIRLAEVSGNALIRYGTRNLGAYQLYLQGRYRWNRRSEDDVREALKCFEQAIAEDRGYAQAYVGLADCHAALVWLGVLAPKAGWPRAAEAVEMALEIDGTLGEAVASLGCVRAVYEWAWDSAEAELRRAIDLNPRYANAHHWYSAFCLAPQRRLDEAVLELRLAQELDPSSPAIATHLGWLLYCRRQYEAAIEQLRASLGLDPMFHLAYWHLGYVCMQLGRFDDALEAFGRTLELSGRAPLALSALGQCLGLMGRKQEALKLLDELNRLAGSRYVSSLDIAGIHFGLGETDTTLGYLEQAREERCSRLINLLIDPVFDNLRPEPRFVALLRDMNLDQ